MSNSFIENIRFAKLNSILIKKGYKTNNNQKQSGYGKLIKADIKKLFLFNIQKNNSLIKELRKLYLGMDDKQITEHILTLINQTCGGSYTSEIDIDRMFGMFLEDVVNAVCVMEMRKESREIKNIDKQLWRYVWKKLHNIK